MMRLLYLTDTHIRGTSPRSRTDDFQQTLCMKLAEVIEIAKREEVDAVLHGGDVFDRPNLSPAVVRQFAQLFRQFPAPVYAIAGNHDMYGHNPATIDRTMLGLLDAFGTLQLIRAGEKILLKKNGVTLQLSGQPFHYDLDKRPRKLDYGVEKEEGVDYRLHMVHGMLVDRALPDGVAHTMIGELWELEDPVDVLLTGHYHTGFPIQQRAGKYIVNPGALARIHNHTTEISRMPQVVQLDFTEGIQVKLIPLQTAARGEKVLDRSYIEKMAYRQERLADFVQQVRAAGDFRSMDVMDIIRDISSLHQIEDEVRGEAQRRIAIAQAAEEGETDG
jgi:DNA repair protein SbcD/Mre11